jgi:outer membrane protein assembly factor BamA
MKVPYGFALFRADVSTLFTDAGLDSGTFSGTATVVLQPIARQSLTIYAGATRDVEPYPGEEADLGLTSGPRAFPIHAFTGDRAFFTSAEYRWTPWASVLQLFNLGFGAFIDYGGAWFGNESPRTGADAGIGLRFASTRSGSQVGATRIDLARRFAGDSGPAKWVIAIGTGFLFESLW